MPKKKQAPPKDEKKDEDVVDEQNPTIKDFLGDRADDAADDESKVVDKDEEIKAKLDKKVDEKVDEKEEPKIDLEEEARKIKEDVVNRVRTSLGLTDEEVKQTEDEGIEAPWVKEKRTPKTYEEVAEYAADLAEWKRQQAEKKAAALKEEQDKRQSQSRQQIESMWDEQLEDLRSTGKLPKVSDSIAAKMKKGGQLTEDEKRDPGIQAQKRLFEAMADVNVKRQQDGKPMVVNLKEVFYEHYKEKKQPAGADAPVSGGSTGVNPDTGDFKYSDIAGKDFYGIIESQNE